MCFHNLSYGELFDHEARNRDGVFTNNGAFSVLTGKFTGRSPRDRYIVKQEPSMNDVWWCDINREITPDVYEVLESKVINYYRNNVQNIYVFDGFCGASNDPKNRKKVRFITEKAWHHHFVSNMFIKPTKQELANFGDPDFTCINCYGLTDDNWQKHGFVIFFYYLSHCLSFFSFVSPAYLSLTVDCVSSFPSGQKNIIGRNYNCKQ